MSNETKDKHSEFEGHTPDNTKDTPIDYNRCECGGRVIMFTSDLDICQKCGKQYEPRSTPYLLKENQSLKLELQKQKELNAELVKGVDYAIERIKDFDFKGDEYLESLIKKSNEI